MNTPNTDKLIELIDQFPTIKRIEFDNDNHREFVKKLLLACKNVRPELDAMKLLAERMERAAPTPLPANASVRTISLASEVPPGFLCPKCGGTIPSCCVCPKPAIEEKTAVEFQNVPAADPVPLAPAITKARNAATRSRTKPSDIAKSS